MIDRIPTLLLAAALLPAQPFAAAAQSDCAAGGPQVTQACVQARSRGAYLRGLRDMCVRANGRFGQAGRQASCTLPDGSVGTRGRLDFVVYDVFRLARTQACAGVAGSGVPSACADQTARGAWLLAVSQLCTGARGAYANGNCQLPPGQGRWIGDETTGTPGVR